MRNGHTGYVAGSGRPTKRRHHVSDGTEGQDANDMVSVLKKDHEEMKEYFREIEGSTDPEQRRDIADRLTAEVARHSVAEEMYLYPAARKVLPNGDELIDEEIKEHSEAEELLKKWEGMKGDDPEFMPTFEKIRDGLLHHIDEEEEPKLFPEMQAALSEEEQEKLGHKITTAKKLAPTRPHPSAPDGPPGDKILGIPTGIVDRIRDKMSGRSTS
jgi:hemerythrin superfamily protein